MDFYMYEKLKEIEEMCFENRNILNQLIQELKAKDKKQ